MCLQRVVDSLNATAPMVDEGQSNEKRGDIWLASDTLKHPSDSQKRVNQGWGHLPEAQQLA